ncbi:hypothetical protein M0R89_19215 (plasmid) [Halorussus limi]|uniref:Uncharacterized protein n=1 Tax=Halorussus limi TaxID=2938695 RepID=A0A8U0I0V8_9EURY|nr:hypothetical protein [Halorussus limi]UPV76663.1 hypothetical protein M0R89_19215 [Halorussus limi]
MTDNHEYQTPSKGANDWHIPINKNFAALDADVEIRDAAQNRSQYKPKQGAKFLATDSGERFIGDGSQWTKLPYPGSSDGQTTSQTNEGDRPLTTTGSVGVTVDSGGGGDYESIQAAINNEVPWLVQHPIDIGVKGGTYDEDILLPPYMSNWAEQGDRGERIPIQITGDTNSPSNVKVNSFMATGGVGVTQIRGIEFTGVSPYDDENTAFSVYNTNRVGIIDCNINTSGNAMTAYNGQICAVRVKVNGGGWGIKVKHNGQYWESGSGVSGSVSGKAYNMDDGTIKFNHKDNGHISGNPTVAADKSHDGGFVLDEGKGRLYGVNRLAVADQSDGSLHDIVVENGSVTAKKL